MNHLQKVIHKSIAVILIAAAIFTNDLPVLSYARIVNDLIPVASDSNASDSNASDSNASDSDASDSNATASDAGIYGKVIDESSMIVYTYEELKTALGGDNSYTTIYLGDNITTTNSGVSINASKPYVVIDGLPPGQEGSEPYTLTQHNSTNLNYTIRVEAANTVTKEVILRNMTVIGGNYYGIVAVLAKDVTLIHDNLTYSGPQPVYNRQGTTQFIDSAYELKTVSGVVVNELAETRYAEFGGEVSITAVKTASPIIRMESSASTLILQEGTNLTVQTNFCFINTSGYAPVVTLKQGASLELTSSRFGFTYADQRISNFLMEEGSNLFIDQKTSESYAALRVSKLFKMNPGSSLNIIRTGTAGIPLRLTNVGASAVFDQPYRVFLYSSAGVPLRFTGSGTLEITTRALNIWGKTSWPAAEGGMGIATHIWNRVGTENLVVTGTYQETVNRTLGHNLTKDDPVVSTLNSQNFNLERNQLLAFGEADLKIDPLHPERPISGSTNADAFVNAAYITSDNVNETADTTAEADGNYQLPTGVYGLLPESMVTVIATWDYLNIRKQSVVSAELPVLKFLSVPEWLDFGTIEIPDRRTELKRQNNEDFSLMVWDSRPASSKWHIDVYLEQILTSADEGKTLPDGLIFKDADGSMKTVNEVPMTAYRKDADIGQEIPVSWQEEEGLYLQVSPGMVYSDTKYTGTITWLLVDAP